MVNWTRRATTYETHSYKQKNTEQDELKETKS